MKSKTVKQLMVPLEEYATVSEDATLYEAIIALEKAQREFDQEKYRHRAILVFDKRKRIVGKVSQMDVIRSLEPKYSEIGDIGKLSRAGFSPSFLRSMLEQYSLWDEPIDEICNKASRMRVKDVMYRPTEGEYIQEDASLGEAIHQLVMGHHQSLLVVGAKGRIVGILRLSDVFKEVCEITKICKI
jgi:CBS domain-containing protein